jgi:hypothetical protein
VTDTATWENLPPPQDLGGEDDSNLPPEPDQTPETAEADAPLCPVCGEPIIRDPSWRRMHKYHDGCTPSHKAGEAGGAKRTRTGGKAEKEADRCEEILKGFLVKAALGISVVDKYDGACIMMNAPALCSSFRATCLRYEDLRKEFLKVPEGGSVAGLVMALALMLAPMAAHHGLIPGTKIAPFIANLPFAMYRLQSKLSEGEAGLKSLMAEQMEELRRARDESAARARSAANGQHVPAN